MKHVRSYLSALFSALRPLAIAATCALVIFSSSAPALAVWGIGGSDSNPSEGLEKMDTIQEKSEDAITGSIDYANDARSVMKNSQEGLNGVQGAANKENMISPDDTNATTIESKVEEALEEATP
ncbi:MAG: hypothetical protein HC800_00420 [Phormidesmis sp. RL_2_1]|nr:hypothetical protein [Phormidesmis sp. RL_2_1]